MEQHTAMQATPAGARPTVQVDLEDSLRFDRVAGTIADAPRYLSAFTSRVPSMLTRARFWPVRFTKTASIVARDADRLIQQCGEAAYEKAALLSSQEDAGLVSSPSAGHWWRVRDEIGSRLGLQAFDRRADFVPG